ncbi:MAG: hypothetical protein NC543_15955 [bacterium]|nr:hypothetical protein [bacterium]MCM1376696.1 hypothetical protein [Muribaculum sp.]
MKNKATKKATISALNVMIECADKGPSGFWTGDQEVCGNPQIFPEFEKGLKGNRLVQKEHYLCPWNTVVLYGGNRCNALSGCYHSCSIKKTKYLSAEMLREVLIRFRTRLQNGGYDNFEQLAPLLTPNEITYIEKQVHKEEAEQKKRQEKERRERLKKTSALIKKFPDKENLFSAYYGKKELVCTYDGTIDFNPEGYRDVVGAEKFTYAEYLEVQIKSFHKTRGWFEECYHNIPLGFKGCIEKNTGKNVCFQRIVVEGMYLDGDCFVGKEDHVWMDISGFEIFQVGDCVSFSAEIYRYVKTGNGKQIDFGLRNPQGIKRIEAYELPSDDELMEQEIEQMVCETCYLEEHCNKASCLRPKKDMRILKKQMLDVLKGNHVKNDSQQ